MNSTLNTLKYTNQYTANYYVWIIDLRDIKYRCILTKFRIMTMYINSLSLGKRSMTVPSGLYNVIIKIISIVKPTICTFCIQFTMNWVQKGHLVGFAVLIYTTINGQQNINFIIKIYWYNKASTEKTPWSGDLKCLCSNVYGSNCNNKDFTKFAAFLRGFVSYSPVDNLKCKSVWFNATMRFQYKYTVTWNTMKLYTHTHTHTQTQTRGPGSLVSIATGDGLDGPGIESR
jgi:hypothetical protein